MRQYFVKDESGLCVWSNMMSSDAADVLDVNLSTSAGKSSEPVQRTSARVRKPNSSLDQKGVSLERIRELRKKRGRVLSSLSAKRREIDNLLTDESNLEAVKIKLPEITSLFRKFAEVQHAYHEALTDEGQRQESEVYFTEIESSMDFFCRTVNDWLRVTETSLHDNLVTPDDSVSLVGVGLQNKPKTSECGSRSSRLSRTSSLSAERAKEAARIAELRAEVLALNQRHSLQETELLLKRQEYELQLKKEELNLKTEYAKALAREEAYAQAEAGNFVPIKVPASNTCVDVPDVSQNTKVTWSDSVKTSQSVLPGKKGGSVKARVNLAAIDQSSVASGSSSGSEKSGLSDMAYDILAQQNRVMKEFVSQQQRNSLPRRRVPVFSGNPLDYCTFIRAFETVIETRESDYAGRLYYLEQHTAGRPQELVRSCLYMNAEAGYLKARKLLESKFGQKHKIAMAYLDKVTNGPVIKAEDAEALEGFATLLASCTNTLKAIGYSSKFESPDCMRKIIDRLPPKLQASWRDNADRILSTEGRDICIDDISLFVEQKARALSNPVFGKLPFLEKEKKSNRDRGLRSKSEKRGEKQLALVTITDKKPPSTSSRDLSNSTKPSQKKCPFYQADHSLTECSSFAKVPDADQRDFVMKQRLCFSCLNGGHQSKVCYKKKPCNHCDRKHATVLHPSTPEVVVGVETQRGFGGAESREGRPQSLNSQLNTTQNTGDHFCGLTSMEGPSVTALPIVAVKVKVKGSPLCIETYALLDNGSNSTFCSASLMERLMLVGKKTRLKLITMDSSKDVYTTLVNHLVLSDLDENVAIPLSEVLSRPAMPVARDEIPKQEDVERWSHLQGHVYLSDLDSGVDLLIGADVPEALQPREIIPAADGGPYATRVDLGWVINGPTGRKQKYVPCSSFFITSKKTHPMCAACTDLMDAPYSDGLSMSRDDLKFMNIVEDSVVKCADGHYQVSLPLRNRNVKMPVNRSQAERSASYLKRKLSSDTRLCENYVAFLEEVISAGYAEKVPQNVLHG